MSPDDSTEELLPTLEGVETPLNLTQMIQDGVFEDIDFDEVGTGTDCNVPRIAFPGMREDSQQSKNNEANVMTMAENHQPMTGFPGLEVEPPLPIQRLIQLQSTSQVSPGSPATMTLRNGKRKINKKKVVANVATLPSTSVGRNALNYIPSATELGLSNTANASNQHDANHASAEGSASVEPLPSTSSSNRLSNTANASRQHVATLPSSTSASVQGLSPLKSASSSDLLMIPNSTVDVTAQVVSSLPGLSNADQLIQHPPLPSASVQSSTTTVQDITQKAINFASKMFKAPSIPSTEQEEVDVDEVAPTCFIFLEWRS